MITRRQLSILAEADSLTALSSVRAQGSKIILGQSAAFTGPAAQLGIQFHQGAKIWFDQVNARGGVDGRSIEIRTLDDGYEPDRCAENTRKLIDQDVFALFGYIGTPTSLAALALTLKEQVPFIAPFTGSMGLREPLRRNVFHLRASYNDETALIVRQLTIAREFAEAVKKAGGAANANFSSMEGYLAARMVTEGLNRAGGKGVTREGLVRGIEAMGNHSFGGFGVQFSASNHVGSSFVELSMLTGDGRVRT